MGGEAGLAGSAGLSSRLSLAWGTLSLYFIPGKDRPPCSLMLTCTSAHLVPRCPCSKGEADAPFIPFLLLRLLSPVRLVSQSPGTFVVPGT